MIDKLEMLIALAREKHFGRAAEACHVTQPSLSSAIRALEELYGVQLVQRGPRFLGLTAEGERLLVRARAIVAEARAIHTDLQQMQADLQGSLRLGVIPTALTTAQAVAGRFLDRNKGVRLEVRSMTSQDILDALADYRIDAGISYAQDDIGEVPGGKLQAIPLYRESYALLVSETSGPKTIRWSDLAGMQLCLLTRDMQNRRILDRILSELGIAADPVVEANSILALVNHVREHPDRATILPRQLAEFFTLLPGLASHPIGGDEAVDLPAVALLVPGAGRRSVIADKLVQETAPIDIAYRSTETSI